VQTRLVVRPALQLLLALGTLRNLADVLVMPNDRLPPVAPLWALPAVTRLQTKIGVQLDGNAER
jgi:hypothetical protein